MIENDDLSNKKRLLRSFDRAGKWLLAPLASHYGKEYSIAMGKKVREDYENLIPDIPYIGGAKNHWTSDLLESVQYLALYRALQSDGKPMDEIVAIMYEGMRIRLNQYPGVLLRLIGRVQFSNLFINRLKRLAEDTQKQVYPDNFKAEIVMGDGKEFDWGINFSECSIHKFYIAHHAQEFLPHVCKLDYITSAAFGLGLVRTKTISNGDDRCNPRLKWGRPTQWN